MPPLSFRHKFKNVWLKMGDEKIWESAQQTLLGMEIGRKLAVLSSSVSETI